MGTLPARLFTFSFCSSQFFYSLYLFLLVSTTDVQAFVPFEDTPTLLPPWPPLSVFPTADYWQIRGRQGHRLATAMVGSTAELGFKRIFRTFCLLSAHRRGSTIGPSGAWEALISPRMVEFGIGPDIGLLFDDLFLILTRPSPALEWYVQLYATRDTLFTFWLQNPRLHTKSINTIIALICNALAIVHISLLATQGGTGRRTAANLRAALPCET